MASSLQATSGSFTLGDAYSHLSQFHENEGLVAWWQRTFATELTWFFSRRRNLLVIGSVAAAIASPWYELSRAKFSIAIDGYEKSIAIALLFALVWLSFRAAAGFERLPGTIRRHPQVAMHCVLWLTLIGAWLAPDERTRAVFACVVLLIPIVIWRCGYMMLSAKRGKMNSKRFRDHIVYLFPVWHGSNTPYGKGLDYLSRHEAKSEKDLVRSQLAGIKLLILALAWGVLLKLMDIFVFAPEAPGAATLDLSLSIPRVESLISHRASVALPVVWCSLYCELIWQVLRHAANGHIIIGILRLLGFNVFRNTYKPLYAQSLIVFWNRYFFYFKELLAEFFFFPVFSKAFKSRIWLRLFAALFASAFLGNLYYHILKDERLLLAGDLGGVRDAFGCRAFYCLLLACGLFVSMVREQRRAGQHQGFSLPRKIVRIAGVWTFFAMIYIWHGRGHFWDRTQFFLSLFAIV